MAILDSLGYARFLRDGGVPPEQAETHADAARRFIMADLVNGRSCDQGRSRRADAPHWRPRGNNACGSGKPACRADGNYAAAPLAWIKTWSRKASYNRSWKSSRCA